MIHSINQTLQLAREQTVQKKYLDALESYDIALYFYPSNSQIFYEKAEVLLKLERYQEALVNADLATRLNPYNDQGFITLGTAYYHLKKYNEALNAYNIAIGINPYCAVAFDSKGQTLVALGNYVDAAEAFERVLAIEPRNLRTAQDQLNCFEKAGMYQKELEAADRVIALEEDENNPNFIFYKANALFYLKRYEEALIWYDEVLLRNPNNSDAHVGKGSSYYGLGMYDDSYMEYNKAVSMDPNNPFYVCCRGKALMAMPNKDSEALADFNHAFELIEQGLGGDLPDKHIDYIGNVISADRKMLLQKVMELKTGTTTIKAEAKKIEKENSQAKTLVQRIEEFEMNNRNIIQTTIEQSIIKRSKPDVKKVEEGLKELERLKAELNSVKEQLRRHDNIIVISNTQAKAEIKQEFSKMRDMDPRLYEYTKTLYWTLLNYFTAYRSLSTEIFAVDVNFDEEMAVKGVQKMLEIGSSMIEGVPFIGGLLKGLENIASEIYSWNKERKVQNKATIINTVIFRYFETDEDLSIMIAKTAITVSKINPHQRESNIQVIKNSQYQRGLKWV